MEGIGRLATLKEVVGILLTAAQYRVFGVQGARKVPSSSRRTFVSWPIPS
jgi:hypothetical protein